MQLRKKYGNFKKNILVLSFLIVHYNQYKNDKLQNYYFDLLHTFGKHG